MPGRHIGVVGAGKVSHVGQPVERGRPKPGPCPPRAQRLECRDQRFSQRDQIVDRLLGRTRIETDLLFGRADKEMAVIAWDHVPRSLDHDPAQQDAIGVIKHHLPSHRQDPVLHAGLAQERPGPRPHRDADGLSRVRRAITGGDRPAVRNVDLANGIPDHAHTPLSAGGRQRVQVARVPQLGLVRREIGHSQRRIGLKFRLQVSAGVRFQSMPLDALFVVHRPGTGETGCFACRARHMNRSTPAIPRVDPGRLAQLLGPHRVQFVRQAAEPLHRMQCGVE